MAAAARSVRRIPVLPFLSERQAPATLIVCAAVVAIFIGGVPIATAQSSPTGRFALFGNWSQRTDSSNRSDNYSDLVGRFNLESDRSPNSIFEYSFDARIATYPSTDREQVFNLYEAFIGFQTSNGRFNVRFGQQWIREMGGLGSVGGLSFEYRIPKQSPVGRFRFGLFAGLEPQYLDAGYVDGITKGGAYVAVDGDHGRRHVLGWVTVRNSDLIERSVVVFNNFFSVASKLYIYQVLEYDLNGPAGLADGGLTYFLANLRYRPARFLEFQASYHDGRSIDSRTITDDAIAGRPVNPEALEGFLFESARLRMAWNPNRKVRLWVGVGSDRYSRDDAARDRLQFGVHFADLLNTGLDVSGTSTSFKNGDEKYDAMYLSLGRSFGRKIYVSFDYSKALAFYRYDSTDGGEIVVRPNSERFSLSTNVNINRNWTLLLTAEYLDQQNFEEMRGLAGIIFRF